LRFDIDSAAIIGDVLWTGRSRVVGNVTLSRRGLLFAVLVCSALGVASTSAAGASDGASSTPTARSFSLFAPQEMSFRFFYGMADKESLDFYTFGPRVAYDLLPSIIPPILGNRIRLAIEMFGSIIHGDNHPLDGEFAFSPLIFNYRYDAGGSLVPFIEGGEGIVLTTLDGLNIGGPFEFSSQAGGGIQWFFSAKHALTIDARYRHISNLGISDDNSGLDTVFVGVSLGHFPDRP
jgi:hypothetical protein